MDAFSGDLILPRDERSSDDTGGKREPLMTKEQWREKAHQRVETRKQRRIAYRQGNQQATTPLPIDIDWRPLKGSIGLPDPASVTSFIMQGPINRKRALSHRESHKLKISMDVKHDGQVDNEDELYALRSGSDRSKSMDNLDDLEVRYSSLALCDIPICES